MKNTRKLVFIALMISGALVLSLIDSKIVLIPIFPGIKIGIANIVTIIVLYFFSWKEAMMVTVIRCVLTGIFSGNPISLIFGLTGGVLSTAAMSLMFQKYPRFFSIIGISLCGAEIHNFGQLIAASFLLGSKTMFFYAPYLLIVGAISGFGIGLVSSKVCKLFDVGALMKIE